METYTLPYMPTELSQIHVRLFKNVSNAKDLRAGLIAAATMEGEAGDLERDKYDYCFVEAKTILSRSHLLTAIHQALISAAHNTLSTKTAHSEVLFVLNPSNNITDSLRNFGVSPKTSSLLLVRFSPAGSDGAQVAKDMEELIEGEPIGLDELGQEGITDWNVVRKLYKLTVQEAADRQRMESIIVSTVGMKSVSS